MAAPERLEELEDMAAPRPARGLAWMTISIAGLILLPIVLSSGSVALKDLRLDRFVDAVCGHPLPPRTQVTSCEHEFGLLEGNGNHCDYRVRARLRSELTSSELRGHYQGLTFPSPNGDWELPADLRFTRGAPSSGARGAELEVTQIAGQEPGLDIRCH